MSKLVTNYRSLNLYINNYLSQSFEILYTLQLGWFNKYPCIKINHWFTNYEGSKVTWNGSWKINIARCQLLTWLNTVVHVLMSSLHQFSVLYFYFTVIYLFCLKLIRLIMRCLEATLNPATTNKRPFLLDLVAP